MREVACPLQQYHHHKFLYGPDGIPVQASTTVQEEGKVDAEGDVKQTENRTRRTRRLSWIEEDRKS